jgi:hypothetical protein
VGVDDATGRPLAYVYGRDDEGEAGSSHLTIDEARRMAVNIARLPERLGRADQSSPPRASPYGIRHRTE